MTEMAAIVIVGIGTYATRALFIVALANRKIPDPVLDALQFVGPAVLSALVVTMLVGADGTIELGWQESVALAGGGVAAYWTRNMLFTVVVGMGLFWLLGAIW